MLYPQHAYAQNILAMHEFYVGGLFLQENQVTSLVAVVLPLIPKDRFADAFQLQNLGPLGFGHWCWKVSRTIERIILAGAGERRTSGKSIYY